MATDAHNHDPNVAHHFENADQRQALITLMIRVASDHFRVFQKLFL